MTSQPPQIVFDKLSLYLDGKCYLKQVDLQLHEGQTLVIAGAPGCGKSFVLRVLLGMPGVPQSEVVEYEGEVLVEGISILGLNSSELQKMRRQMGSLMRGGGLIDNMDIRRNITLPLVYHFRELMDIEDIDARCSSLLAAMGFEYLDQPGRRPVSLNREEMLYVALSRALINAPRLLLLDDPLLGLSPGAAIRFLDFLFYRPEFGDGIHLHKNDSGAVTRLLATSSLNYYLKRGDLFAVLHNQSLIMVGDQEAVLQSKDPYVQDLLSPRESNNE